MIGFGLFALFDVQFSPFKIRWRGTFPWRLSALLQQPDWWILSVPFLLVLFGAFYSDDSWYWLSRLRIKLPFVLFPMAFFLIPAISKTCYYWVHLALLVVLALSTLPLVWQLTTEFQQILLRLQQGQPLDTPGSSHIRYSLLMALASLSGLLLWHQKFFERSTWQSKLVLALSLWLYLSLHLLAVRSGVAAFYLTALVLLLKRVWFMGWSWSRASLLIILLLLPAMAYHTIPTFKHRINYMVEDIGNYQMKKWNAYSDAERLLSIKAGIEIGKVHPWIGVGPGDLREAMRLYFYQHFDKDTFILPHNQLVTVYAGSGLVGLVAFTRISYGTASVAQALY